MKMSDLIISLRLAWRVVVRNWVVYRKDFLANISPTLADPALMMTALGMGLSPFIGSIHGLRLLSVSRSGDGGDHGSLYSVF